MHRQDKNKKLTRLFFSSNLEKIFTKIYCELCSKCAGGEKMNDKVTVFQYYDLFAKDNNDCPTSCQRIGAIFRCLV